jgi:sugar-specific transcriptional regulator TrmB
VRGLEPKTIERVLALIGFDPNENKMRVLAAIVKSRTHEHEWISFKDLYAQLLLEKGSDYVSEPLVYRALTDLEEEGYVSVDRSSYRHGYKCGFGEISSSLKNMILKRKRDLRRAIAEISRDLDVINDLERRPPMSLFLEALTGVRPEDSTEYVTGLKRVTGIVDEIIYDRGRKGDIVRVSTGWVGPYSTQFNGWMTSIEHLARRGVEVRILTSRNLEIPDETADILRRKYKALRDASVNIQIRQRISESAIYQMAARNRNELILIVSDEPLAATFIPRNANPLLIDNSIEVFDREFDRAVDVLEAYREGVSEP